MKNIILSSFFLCSSFGLFAANYSLNLNSENAQVISPLSGNSAFTVELWFNGSGTGTYDRLIGWTGNEFEISIGQGNLFIYDGAWRNPNVSGCDIGWHHVAVTNDLTTMRVYYDGLEVLNKPSATFNFGGSMFICATSGGVETTQADVDELRVWNYNRTALDIAITSHLQIVGDESGLISYYPFNKQSLGNLVSGGQPLVPSAGISYSNEGFGTYLEDFGMNFDGNDDQLSVNTTLIGNQDFTLECHFRTTSTSMNHERVFSHDGYEMEIGIVNGEVRVYTGSWISTSTTNVNDGIWHHCAVTHNAGILTVYIDGGIVYQASVGVFTFTAGNKMYIGQPDQLLSDIDELRVWSFARSQLEIQSTINSDLDGNETGLEMYYDFNTPSASINIQSLTSSDDFIRIGASGINNLPQFFSIINKNVIILDPVNGLAETADKILLIYPNPASEYVTIHGVDSQSIISINIYDVTGRIKANTVGNDNSIHISNLPAGIYTMIILTETASYKQNFTKQ